MSINIRLSESEISIMKNLFKKHFQFGDALWVFGSRADQTKRGGDIDLYIETNYSEASMAIRKKIEFLSDLKFAIGDQRIDVVINPLVLKNEQRIYAEAKQTGVCLIG